MLEAIDIAEEVKGGKTVFTILSGNGDDRLVWDSADPEQVKEAIEKFDEMMENGYTAFLVDDKGKAADTITRSDWAKKSVRQAEEILFGEPKEVQMVRPVVGG